MTKSKFSWFSNLEAMCS